jgi:alpha-ketoglutarate-dependent taurine dioxygenase
MAVELRALSETFGVELCGLDLRAPQPDDVRELAVDALREHLLVLVRGPELSIAEHRRFVEWFGPIDVEGALGAFETPRGEHYISNTRSDGGARDGELLRHQDYCFQDRPVPAISLYAEVAPAVGGETVFTNVVGAYERLPTDLRRRIASLDAVHVYDPEHPATSRYRVATAPVGAPHATHPVVVAHPVTGRPVLYVNPLMTDSIVGVPGEESDALLEELWSYGARPELQYEHRWAPHDLIVWDNIALQHARRTFPPGTPRSLRRLQVGTRRATASVA